MRILSLLLLGFVLVGCGAASKTTLSELNTSAPVDIGPNGAPCSYLQAQSNSTLTDDLVGVQVCQAVATNQIVFKASAASVGANLCIFPLSAYAGFAETCLTIAAGDTTITLSTDQYSGIAIVLNTDDAAFSNYLQTSAGAAPNYAYTLLR